MLLVGLGNPGSKYQRTRHNAGFMAIDEISESYGFSDYKEKFSGLFASGDVEGNSHFLLKPQTFMNESGISVQKLASFYKISVEEIIIFHDEIDLPLGKIRVKQGGGAGGHNGLRSVDSHLDRNYWRVRIGVGHPGDKDMVSPYVLSDFNNAELKIVEDICIKIADELPILISGDHEKFMNKLGPVEI